MSRFWISIYYPDDYNPALSEDESMGRDIDDLNDEMVAAGVRVFVGGLFPARDAKSVIPQHNGEVQVVEGPYLRTGEHAGGFWVLELASMDEAVEWGRKAALACRTSVQVRPFH